MDKLERYLDQACRGVGGPRALRQHLRQELREHLLDAVAEHKAAGLSEEEATDRALADFGGPEQVRSELEATHGHRLLPVLIDRAMQWKEKTMRAKWLWTTWAYLALVGVIALEVMLVTFIVIYIIPKFQRLTHDGMIDAAALREQGVTWMAEFLHRVSYVGGHYTTQMLLLAAAAWGLLEWRVSSENKPFIRLSVLGTAAVGLMVVVVLTVGSLVVPFTLCMPALGQMSRPFAVAQVTTVDSALRGIEQSLAKKDWEAMKARAEQASHALSKLSVGPAIHSLAEQDGRPTDEELKARLTAAGASFHEVRQAIHYENAERLKEAMAKFRESFGPLDQASKRPPR